MKILTDDNFKEETKNGIYVIDLYAEWCGPCRALAPILEEMDGKVEGVNFVKLDVNASPITSGDFGIMSIPTVLILKDGKEVKRIVGLYPKSTYVEAVNEVLNSKS